MSQKTLTSFDKIVDHVIRCEGGYCNNPKDKGGKTKYGISQRSYPRLNIRSLTKKEAKDIYRRDYWDRYKVGKIPAKLRHIYMDMIINMGPKNATKVFQRAANARGSKLVVDGLIGPKTIRAVQKVELDRIRSYRIRYYADLVKRNNSQEVFWFGWFKRALAV